MTKKKEEFKTPLLTMWIQKSKDGSKQYLSGVDASGKRYIGFINGKKKNPKEPDIRIYTQEDDKLQEFTGFWVNVSKNGKKYLSGKMFGERIVGFINSKATVGGKIPYFSIYESTPAADQTEKQEQMAEVTEDVPF